jgi:phosphatidylglycerophosphate synthase
MHAGDVLTALRIVAAPAYAAAFLAAGDAPIMGWAAGALFVYACVSDYLDGKLARRAGRASARGRVFDSLADIIFILAALGAGWAAGAVPWWVPAAIAASFAYYAIDSLVLTRRAPQRTFIASRLGHWGGVANFAIVGVVTFNHGCGLHWLGPEVMQALFALAPVYSAAAILARLR